MQLLKNIFWVKRSYFTRVIIILSFLIGLCFAWVMHPNNYFIFDDYGHFVYVNTPDFFGNYSLLPKQMYNDRPGGEFLIWGLWKTFGFNPVPSHVLFVLIHFANSLLLFLVAKKLGYTNHQAFAVSLLFALWPKSTHAVRWISAVFDLLGLTFALSSILLSLTATTKATTVKNTVWWKIASFGMFFIAIRTKESVLTIPVVLLAVSLIQKKAELFKHSLGLLGLSLSYLSLLIYFTLNSKLMDITTDNAPYRVVTTPVSLLTMGSKYMVMFFAFTNAHIQFNREFLFPILCLFIAVSVCVYTWLKKKKFLPLALLISTVVTLGPVLPLVNMEHKLYLYIPSVFFFLALGWFISSKFKLGILILLLVYLNFYERSFWDEKNWWWQIGAQNKLSFSLLKTLPPVTSEKTIAIYNNQNPASLFQYGPGNVLQLFFHERGLSITDTPDPQPISNIPYQINYNQGNLVFVGENYQANICAYPIK